MNNFIPYIELTLMNNFIPYIELTLIKGFSLIGKKI